MGDDEDISDVRKAEILTMIDLARDEANLEIKEMLEMELVASRSSLPPLLTAVGLPSQPLSPSILSPGPTSVPTSFSGNAPTPTVLTPSDITSYLLPWYVMKSQSVDNAR